MTEYRNIPIFLPELACPHQCVFCNQQHISGSLTIPQPKEIYLIIEQNLATMLPDAHIQVAFFGGSFTGLPLDIQHAYLQAVQPYIIQGRVAGIRLSTRPDYITQEIVHMLANYGVQEIELGAQSVHNDVLLKSGRGHTYEDIQRASAIILQNNIRLGLQMMIGLPGDSYDKAIKTAKTIIELGAHSTRIYPTLVIEHTQLASMYRKRKYSPLSLTDAVQITKDVYQLFVQHGVTVLRVGLHPSKDLHNPEVLLAGPYHQSFKELVETALWADIFEKQIPITTGHIQIFVPSAQIQFAIGHKSVNKIYLQQHIGKVTFIPHKELLPYECTYSYH